MKRIGFFTALASAAAAMFAATGGGTTAKPTLYFMYAMNCTITIVDDSGKPVTSVAPGAYQVDVRTPVPFATLPLVGAAASDMTACKGIPQFQLTGPGVNLFTTMSAGCEEDMVFPETFAPSATYTAVDLNQPTVAHATFATLASGTPAAPTVTYGGGKGKSETSTDIVGSARVQGTLKALVSAKGVLTLTASGKPVSKLKSGRYTFSIDDQDAKAGLSLLGPTSTKPITLTSGAFRGKHSATLNLTAGRWTYYTTLRTIRYFRVA